MISILKKNKELIRIISMIPFAAIIPIMPINLFLLGIQISCLGIMFYVGWD
jgi:hypothetical protein